MDIWIYGDIYIYIIYIWIYGYYGDIYGETTNNQSATILSNMEVI